MSDISVPCQAALDELKRTSINVDRFWHLVYALAAVATLALIYSIILAALGQTVTAIVSGVGTVLAGSAAGFVTKARDSAIAELSEAKRAVSIDCQPGAGSRGTSLDSTQRPTYFDALIDLI